MVGNEWKPTKTERLRLINKRPIDYCIYIIINNITISKVTFVSFVSY